jgi:hypothetical protein
MAKIEYMKVLDIIAKLFNAEKDLHVDAIHDEADIFTAHMIDLNENRYECKLINHKYKMDISFSKDYMDKYAFKNWLSNFEWELEQQFFVNISLTVDPEATEYRIKISY